jgi:hypothetical protein
VAKLRNYTGAAVITFMLIGLSIFITDSLYENYEITEGNLDENDESLITRMKNEINLIGGVEDIGLAIEKLQDIKISNLFDIVGATTLAAGGVLKVVGGIVTFIPEFFAILLDFYPGLIPESVSLGIGFLVIVYVGYLIYSAYQKQAM